jgi:hypothetical protein
MRRAAQILLVLALVAFAAGVIRWHIVSGRVAQEKRAQGPIARVEFDLSRQDGWKSADYTADRIGPHAIVLETRGLNWEGRPTTSFAMLIRLFQQGTTYSVRAWRGLPFPVVFVNFSGNSLAKKPVRSIWPIVVGLMDLSVRGAGTTVRMS